MSNIYDRRRLWKIIFIAVSLIVAAFFLVVSNNLVNDLSEQERARMEIWANALSCRRNMTGFRTFWMSFIMIYGNILMNWTVLPAP